MNPEKRDRAVFVGAVIMLVYTFIRGLMPSDEVPSSTLNGLTIALELGMFIGVAAMAPRVLRSVPQGGSRAGWIFLLVVGLTAGIGIFGIRLSGDPRVELAPRTANAGSLPDQTHRELVSLESLSRRFASSRWLQTYVTQDPAKMRSLTRQDLEEERAICREARDCTDRILKVFAEATAKGVPHSALSTEPGATHIETWQATREFFGLTYEFLGLIEQHWDEWMANPFPTAQTDLKPWQLEIRRLTEAAAAASRQADAQLLSTTASLSSDASVMLPHELRDKVQLWFKTNEKLGTARWMSLNGDSTKAKTRTREDLKDAQGLVTELQQTSERVLKILAEAKTKGVDLSMAWPSDPAVTRPDLWLAAQEMYTAILEKLALIDQHWDEFRAEQPAPDEKSAKTWRSEVQRLDAVILAKANQLKASSNPSAAPSPTVAQLTGVAKELQGLIASWRVSMDKSTATRWGKIDFNDPAQKRTLTRRDFEEAGIIRRERGEYVERIIKVLAQAKAQGIDLSGVTKDTVLLRPEVWRILHEREALGLKYRKLIDQHWDEWLIAPETLNEKSKPWQREMKRLDDEMEAGQKQLKTLVEAERVAATASVTPTAAAPTPPAPSSAEADAKGATLREWVAALNRNTRPVAPTTSASAPQASTGPAKQLQDLFQSWQKASDKVMATRWMTLNFNDAAQKKTFTRHDLEEAAELSRAQAQYEEPIIKLLAETKAQGLDVSSAATDPLQIQPEFWRAEQELHTLRLEKIKLVDLHWDEWVTTADTGEGELKPWQLEMKRLDEQIVAIKWRSLEDKRMTAASPPAAPSGPSSHMDQLILQTHLLPAIGDYVFALKRLQATRWVKSPDANSYHPKKITAADLHDANDKLRELIVTIDKLRADLDAQAVTVPAAEKEFWRIKHDTSIAFGQLTKLLEDNWKEWHVSGIEPRAGAAKDWQKEAVRLQTAIDKLNENKGTSILL